MAMGMQQLNPVYILGQCHPSLDNAILNATQSSVYYIFFFYFVGSIIAVTSHNAARNGPIEVYEINFSDEEVPLLSGDDEFLDIYAPPASPASSLPSETGSYILLIARVSISYYTSSFHELNVSENKEYE